MRVVITSTRTLVHFLDASLNLVYEHVGKTVLHNSCPYSEPKFGV